MEVEQMEVGMTTRAFLSLSVAIAIGALLFSSAAPAQTQPGQTQGNPPQPGQPQANQQPQGSPPMIILPGQMPPQQPGQPGAQAQPQPMPQTGTVELSFSGTTTQAPTSTAVAPNIEMLTFTMYMTSMNGRPEDFMNVMSGVCSGPAFMHKKSNKMEASGFCNYTDVEGDQVFEHFVIPLQSQDNPLQAKGVWTGGTGKYEGLQGEFILSGIILPATNNNIVQIVGRKAGRYALNQSQVMAPMQPSPPGQAPSSGGSPQPQPGSVQPSSQQEGGGSQPSDQSPGSSQ
jgi:hypothetical protein